jgi:sugar lactone lactonase YvrE
MASSEGTSNGLTSSNGTSTPNSHNYDSDKSEEVEAEQESRCMVCQQAYCDPRVLSCLHTFCCTCMDAMVTIDSDQKFVVCCRCKAKTKLPSKSVEKDLVRNYAILRYTEQLTFNNEDGLTCRSCKDNKPAVARCFDCPNLLCETCVGSHKSLKYFDGHQIYQLHETRREKPKDVACKGVHLKPVAASQYCHACHGEFCDYCATSTHVAHPRTNVTYTFQDPVFSLGMDRRMANEKETYYSENLRTLMASYRKASKDLEKCRAVALQAVNDRLDYLKTEVLNKFFNDALATGQTQCAHFVAYSAQLTGLIEFMTYQSGKVQGWDMARLKPFIDTRMEDVNRLKPQAVPMYCNLEFLPGDLTVIGEIGRVNLSQSSITTPSTSANPPRPIARPTANRPTSSLGQESHGRRGSNSSYGNSWSYHHNLHRDNQSSATVQQGQRNAFNTSPGGTQPSFQREVFNASPAFVPIGYQGESSSLPATVQTPTTHDLFASSPPGSQPTAYQAGSTFPIDHFQMPLSSTGGSLGSPMSQMSLSQPNSANHPNDASVFNFSNLSLNDHSNLWQPASSTSTATHSQSYTTWSAGIDQPQNDFDPNQTVDIFVKPGMFEMPPGANTTSRPARIKRMQMNYFRKFGEYGQEKGDFTEPSGISVDERNNLVVADTNNNRIQVFTVQGEWLYTIDGQSMQFPNRITVSKKTGRIVVTERAPTRRVQVFDRTGHFITAFGEELLQHPRGIALDDFDNIIVIECKVMRVNIFTIDGQLMHRWGASDNLQFPNSVAVNSSQEIFISDNRDTGVKVFNYQGHFLRKIGGPGITDYPIAVAINNEGEVVVADNHNNFNITVFKQDGTLLEGFESKGRHAQCFDVALTDDGVAVVTSKDFKVFCYPYKLNCPYIKHNPHEFIHPKEERSYRRN